MTLQKTQPDKKTAHLSKDPETEIRQQIKHLEEAIHDADLEEIMSCYAPNVVAFDMMPPLQFSGKDAYRKSWEMAVEGAGSGSILKMHDISITASDDVGFSHCLCHCTGTMKDGQKMDMWMRWTDCFEKINGKWLITHEQVSVPIDMESGKALFDLKPDKHISKN